MIAALLVASTLAAAQAPQTGPDPVDELIKLAEQPKPAYRESSSLGPKDPPSESDVRAKHLLTLAIGPYQVRYAATPDAKTWGGALTGAIAVDASFDRTGMINVYRLTFGVDQKGVKSFDLDLAVGYALHLGRLSIGLLGGAGGDLSDNGFKGDDITPGQTLIPSAPYLEYGGRVAYAFDWLPVTVDAIVTKAYRASTRLPVEKRLDARLLFGGFSLGGRYTELVSDREGLFEVFSSKARSGQIFTVQAGVGF